MNGLTALVLAGSRGGAADPMATAAGVRHKALIPVAGTPMLLRVIAALAATPGIGRIVVCIESPQVLASLPGLNDAAAGVPLATFAAAGSPSRSVSAALAEFGTPLLVTTADHALLEPGWVRYFIDHQPANSDATLALARAADVLRAAPDTRRTFLRFSEAAYSGCNLFYFATPAAARLAVLWQRVEAERKRPLRMLALLGYGAVLRYLCGRLSLAEALQRLGTLAGGARAAVVELPFGRAAIDVDKPADLELAERLLRAG